MKEFNLSRVVGLKRATLLRNVSLRGYFSRILTTDTGHFFKRIVFTVGDIQLKTSAGTGALDTQASSITRGCVSEICGWASR